MATEVVSREDLRDILAGFAVRWEMEFTEEYKRTLRVMALDLRADLDRIGTTDFRSAALGVLIGAMGFEKLVRRAAHGYVPTSVEHAQQTGMHSILWLLTEEGGA